MAITSSPGREVEEGRADASPAPHLPCFWVNRHLEALQGHGGFAFLGSSGRGEESAAFSLLGKGERAALHPLQGLSRTLPKTFPSSGRGWISPSLLVWDRHCLASAGRRSILASVCCGGWGKPGTGWWGACPSSRQPESSLLPLLIANAN